MATTTRTKKLYAKNGHYCEMTDALDELSMFYPGDSCMDRFKRGLVRLRMVSEFHPNSKEFLRSEAAINREKYYHLRFNTYMIHPYSDFRMWWDFFMIPIYMLVLIYLPLTAAFYNKGIRGTVYSLIGLNVFKFVDIVLNFFTGYHNTQVHEVQMKQKHVALHYLKGYCFPDIIALLPVYLLSTNFEPNNYEFLAMITVIELFRLRTVFVNMDMVAKYFNKGTDVLRTVRGICCVLMYIHWVTCILIYADHFRLNQVIEKTEYETLMDTVFDYCAFFFVATCVITGACFEVDQTDNVSFYVSHMLILIVSKIFTVTMIAWVARMRIAVTSSHSKYHAMVRQLRDYMSHKQLPREIQKRLLIYYEFRFQKSYFRENEILQTISGQLRQEIILHSCRKLVENVTFFNKLPTPLLIKIVSCLRSVVFLPNDVITRVDTIGDCMFFIATGTVAVYSRSGREICHLEDGYHFGEISLVMRGQKRCASVVAVEVCELYRFDRKDFIRAIVPYPDLLHDIEIIAKQRLEMTNYLDEQHVRMASEKNRNEKRMSS